MSAPSLALSRRRGKPALDADQSALYIPRLSLSRQGSNHGGQLDVARCPLCSTPLVARVRRGGPYFHCLCADR